ncbi:MAG: hypothetical protein KF697_14420 [Pseudolabrys sp.]|nr:hypothetical protein [Pseudolabrys sp.]
MTDTSAAAPAEPSSRAGAPDGTTRIIVIILLLFAVAASLSAARKNVTSGFDELAHISFVAHVQSTGELWPALDTVRMLDPATFRFVDEPNYINHPPFFYVLHAVLGPRLIGNPGALLVHRLIDVAFAIVGLTALLAIGSAARLPRLTFYAYAIPLVCIPVLAPLAGAVNNDNVAFAAGGVATYALWQLIATGGRRWLLIALAATIIASWAKLTGLLLVGGTVSGVAAWLIGRRALPASWALLLAGALTLAAAPYLVYLLQYGSPTPNTPGQIALLQTGAHAQGWDVAARMSPAAYAIYFVAEFIADWMPSLAERSSFNLAMLIIPVVTVLCAMAGVGVAIRRIAQGSRNPLDIVVVASAAACVATFMIHIAFSYGRHIATGWMMDAYPRYYLPVAALVPLACLSLLSAVEQPRIRKAVIGFLIVGPLLFRILGAPPA